MEPKSTRKEASRELPSRVCRSRAATTATNTWDTSATPTTTATEATTGNGNCTESELASGSRTATRASAGTRSGANAVSEIRNSGAEKEKRGLHVVDEEPQQGRDPDRASRKSGSTSKSARRRAELLAQLQLQEAEAAAAKTRLELARLSEDEEATDNDNVEDEIFVERVQDWVRSTSLPIAEPPRHKVMTPPRDRPVTPPRQRQVTPPRWRPRESEETTRQKSDMVVLAEVIANAIKGTAQTDTRPQKFLHELPAFDGDITEWIAFKSVFSDTKRYFSDVQNVARLRKSLKGTAREAVRTLLYTSTDPDEIVYYLEKRYGRPEDIVRAELHSVRKMPKLTDDSSNIGVLASKVANSVATIKSLGLSQYLYSPELIERITDKFNQHVKYRWYEYKSHYPMEPELVRISRFLNDLCDQYGSAASRVREPEEKRTRSLKNSHGKRVHAVRNRYSSTSEEESSESYSDSDSDTECEREGRKRVAVAYESKKKASEVRKQSKCPVCKEKHSLVKCEKFAKMEAQERWRLVKKTRLCFKCLRDNHRKSQCKATACGKNQCKFWHHRLLHVERESESKSDHEEEVENRIPSVNTVGPAAEAYLKIIPVELFGSKGRTTAYALLDDGSTTTLIEEDIANKVSNGGPREELKLEGLGGKRLDEESQRVRFKIKGLFSTEFYTIEAHTMKTLKLAPQKIGRSILQDCEHLLDIRDELEYENGKPTILIGQDNWHLLVTKDLRTGKSCQPVASRTNLGWVLHGKAKGALKTTKFVNYVANPVFKTRDEQMDFNMREYFKLESLGIEQRRPKTDPEERALRILQDTSARLPNGQYEVGLLWKTDGEKMPESRAQAEKRMQVLERKLNKNPATKEEYTKQIHNLFEKGYAERAPEEPVSPRTWYLPHFAVVHPQKGKVRLVFDAAARSHGRCLNDALLTGPDLLQSLYGVLNRFREGPYAVMADIKEMFLRVKIRKEDRDSLRFLWRNNEREPLAEYRMTSLIFGAASSPCTAIYIKNRNARDHQETYPEAAEAIEKHFYMDDYLQAFFDKETAKQRMKEVDLIHRSAGFELRNWASNDPGMLAALPNPSDKTVATMGDDKERTLGLIWNIKSDTFSFTLNLRNTPNEIREGERPPTKREVTSAVMSVYDPLGLAAPITIQGKILIQRIWRKNIDWDEELNEELNIAWKSWLIDLKKLENLEILRCITPARVKGELHTFTDASENAYAAAVYWVFTNPEGTREARLVVAKAKVTPIRPHSVPRLELQAALLGCRLTASFRSETTLDVESNTYWTDSQTVLAWIKSDPRTYKAFVAHRLAEIEELSKPSQWRWVPTKLNVADDATRNAPADFNIAHRWFSGPAFLLEDPAEWPVQTPKAVESKLESDIEKINVKPSAKVHVLQPLQDREKQSVTSRVTPDPSRFSSFNRLLRATARCLQFIRLLKAGCERRHAANSTVRIKQSEVASKKYDRRVAKQNKSVEQARCDHQVTELNFSSLSDQDLRDATELLIRRVQEESFHKELSALKKSEKVPKNSPLGKVALNFNGDVITLSTRVKAAKYLEPTYADPVVLDGKHRITRLLIEKYHRDFYHANHSTVINELRQRYYVTSMRNAVKAVVRSCQWCKVYKGKPQTTPIGDLPKERLQRNHQAFTYAAVDYFGPMQITVGRRHEKRWGALFTCLTTRAVHLELAASLSTDSMILALRRLASRRGMPRVIYSDNGTNFVGANRELKQELQKLNETALSEFAQVKGVIWKFNPPGAPHMGGSWERMVRSVKTALSAVLKERYPQEETLYTLLTEVEHVVNSRPLTDVYLEDSEENLTPNHFLIGRSNGAPVVGVFTDDEMIGKATWRTAQRLADHFWYRWTKEYLPTITPRPSQGKPFSNPQLGDVVIIVDGTLPRATWPRGIIRQIYPGPDGHVRITDVETNAGILRRPTSRLVVVASSTRNSALHEGGNVADATNT